MSPVLSPQVTPYYGGGQVPNPADVLYVTGAPSTALIQYNLGTLAVDNTNQNAYILMGKASGSATWLQFVSSSGSLNTLTGNTGGAIAPSAGNIGIVGSGALSIAGSGHTLTASVAGGGLAYTSVSGTSQAMTKNSGYISANAGLTTFTLPATAALGDTFEIVGKGAAYWTIAQNAGQTIHINNTATTAGTGGSITSTQVNDCIRLVCSVANTDFTVTSISGVIAAYTIV